MGFGRLFITVELEGPSRNGSAFRQATPAIECSDNLNVGHPAGRIGAARLQEHLPVKLCQFRVLGEREIVADRLRSNNLLLLDRFCRGLCTTFDAGKNGQWVIPRGRVMIGI